MVSIALLCSCSPDCKKEINVRSFGLGGVNNEAMWIQADSISPATLVFINNIRCETLYGANSITCTIPKEILQKEQKVIIQLRDRYKKRCSEEITAHFVPQQFIRLSL